VSECTYRDILVTESNHMDAARAVYDWLSKHPNIDATRSVIWSVSMGSFFGLQAAAARREIVPYRQRIRLFRDGEVVPGIRALPLPGHTPGHTGYIVGSGDDTLLIWGDIVHLPEIQLARPEISVILDTDRDAAVAIRKQVLALAADNKSLVTGMHLHFPGFGRVIKRGDGFALRKL
jgi:glyoxylase-like metal-dependent hydrolase (beta-lactamase superfamily II)